MIDEVLAGIKTLPPAPQTLSQLLGALGETDSNVDRVVDMIAVDPPLTARLLQICNSAFFASLTPVNNVADAVGRLGFQTVYRIVTAFAAARCFKPSRPTGLDFAQLWRHSVTVAFAAQFVAEKLEIPDNLIFTAGLLHDLGKAVMAEGFQWDYTCLLEQARRKKKPLCALEKAHFNVDHAEVGARLLKRWNFSSGLVNSVRFHHDPRAAGDLDRLAACLNLADTLAHSAGEDKAFFELAPETAMEILSLAPEDVSRHRQRIKQNLEFVEAMCRLKD